MMDEWCEAGEKIVPSAIHKNINNGGILENEVVVNGVTEQRYWIEN